MNFNTQYTPPPQTLEETSSDSSTVPDMSFSLKDIITRFSRGTLDADELRRNVAYDDDPDIDNPDEIVSDLTEYESYVRRGREILEDVSRANVSSQSVVSPPGEAAEATDATQA